MQISRYKIFVSSQAVKSSTRASEERGVGDGSLTAVRGVSQCEG